MAQLTSPAAAFERLLASGEVHWLRCGSCDALRATLRTVCPACLSREATWQRSAAAGRVVSYFVAHEAVATALEPPYVVAHVELDDGVRLTASLLDTEPPHVRVGARVRLTVDAGRGRPMPAFVLAEDER
jgi:uncharacterized OB-fold protein